MFGVYLRLGFEHLLDLQGADHILFIAVLCAAYSLAEWRRLLVLVTAFTVGHSASLALATLGAVRVDTGLVEFLIPVTIVATAVVNLVSARSGEPIRPSGPGHGDGDSARLGKYGLALVFGLVHGLGFSTFLRLLLGDEGHLFVPLLSFNVGLELAQIAIALTVLALAFFSSRWLGLTPSKWNGAVSMVLGGLALVMAIRRWPG